MNPSWSEDDIARSVNEECCPDSGTFSDLCNVGPESSLSPAEQPQHDRQQNAEKDGRDDRKVNRGVLAAIDDIAGQAADRQVQASADDQQSTYHDQQQA